MIFLSVEMPNEQMVRESSLNKIMQQRQELTDYFRLLRQRPGITQQEFRVKKTSSLCNSPQNQFYFYLGLGRWKGQPIHSNIVHSLQEGICQVQAPWGQVQAARRFSVCNLRKSRSGRQRNFNDRRRQRLDHTFCFSVLCHNDEHHRCVIGLQNVSLQSTWIFGLRLR